VAAVSSDVDQSTPPPAGGGAPRSELRDIARIRPLVGQLSSQIQRLSGHGYDLERARRLAVILDNELGLLAVGAGEAPSLVHASNLAASIVVKLSQLLSPGGRRNDPNDAEDPRLSAALACAEQIAEELSNVAHDQLVPSVTIAYAVREDILAGRLSPGDRLIESDLSERFGISRTSVHDALSQLQREGFVTLVRYRGATVSAILRTDALELMQVWRGLEVLAAQLAAELRGGEVADELAHVVERTLTAGRKQAIDELSLWNTQFHTLVAAASGNSQLRTRLERVLRRVCWLFKQQLQERMDASWTDHAAIAQAILGGSPIQAGYLMGEHIAKSEELLTTLTWT
jgi:DNA-binding GntR family transcriptional regulator